MKTKLLKYAIAIGAIVLAANVWAQESNSSASTAGRFGTEVDDFISTTDFMNVHTQDTGTQFFGFTRLGHGTANGHLELGISVRPKDNLYLGAYYSGWFQGDKSDSTSYDIWITQGGEPKEKRAWTAETARSGYPLDAAVILGLGNLGFKFGYYDTLAETSTLNTASDGLTHKWTGLVKPSIDVGFNEVIPVLKQARVSLGFNRADEVTLQGDNLNLDAAALQNQTSKITSNGSSAGAGVSGFSALKSATKGSYVEPELYVRLSLPLNIRLDNTLDFRFYNNNASESEGHDEAIKDIKGLAYWTTKFDADDAANNELSAIWNNKFYLKDTLEPSYTLDNGTEANLLWAVKFILPIGIEAGSNVYSAKIEKAGKAITAKDFYNEGKFAFGIDPTVKAAVAFKPFGKILNLHAGVNVNILSWTLTTTSTTKKEDGSSAFYDGEAALYGDMDALINGSALNADNYAVSDRSKTDSAFEGPAMDFGAGFTLYLGPCALDFMVLKGAKPTIDGTIYEAVSGGLNAQLVLSAKF
jgi:hypothetical protein